MRAIATIAIRCLIISVIASVLVSCSHITPASKNLSEEKTESPYIIGPMDVLDIQVWKEPDFSSQALVRPDGKITLPLIGDIQASEINTIDLKDLIEKKLADFVENPEVTVIVLESRSKKFYIIGKVRQAGTYPLNPGITVLQALSLAGGLGEWADKDSIRIIRKSGESEKIFSFDYNKVISGKKLGQNILLEPNDTIIVP